MKLKLFYILLVCSLCAACNKDEKQAQRSLEGTWNVTAVASNYGNFSDTGVSIDSTVSENGALGTFQFGDSRVDYQFTANNTIYEGSTPWQLEAEKVNEGFVRVNQFTLTIEDAFVFEVQFEDATKNAEKKAKSATFTEKPPSESSVQVVLWLEKV